MSLANAETRQSDSALKTNSFKRNFSQRVTANNQLDGNVACCTVLQHPDY